MWDRQTSARAQAANKDTSCGGWYVFEKREARARMQADAWGERGLILAGAVVPKVGAQTRHTFAPPLT
eukprot:3238801-Alexandrium_andersonii.AAC.1